MNLLRGFGKGSGFEITSIFFYQVRNFTGFLETVVRHKAQEDEVAVHRVTTVDEFKGEQFPGKNLRG